jgi:two-component system, OmpR family, alkaline phosphatase synthesis response regulator PhoP
MSENHKSSVDILVADDEPHIARALNFIFKKEGYNVEMAFDGDAALLRIRDLGPKIVFLDLIMPKKNGDEVCRAIKSDPDLQNIHVIILTCKGQELDKETSMAAGADEFITKPFSPKEVVARVKAILKAT